ncbi:MAG TPA: helix-turn-helix domain-containing protein [Nodosilinea sp.]|nr:helix-turn-helix domain-containing protein [Nodosilinea sp.]
MAKATAQTAQITQAVDFSEVLRSHMAQAGLTSYRALSQASGVTPAALRRLRQGHIAQLRVATLQQLSHTLGLSLDALVAAFSPAAPAPAGDGDTGAQTRRQEQALRQECERLQTQLTAQATTLRQQVQQEAIAQLEPWLVQWPTAAHAAQQKPDLPAHKLIPLVRPVEALVQSWGLTAIAAVGAEVPFDPQLHQPRQGNPTPGQLVRVTHVGYRQGDRLLYRAKVSPVEA